MKLIKKGKPITHPVKKGNRTLKSRVYKAIDAKTGDFESLRDKILRKLKKIMKRKKFKVGDELQIIVGITDDDMKGEHFYISNKLAKFKSFKDIKLPNLVKNTQYGSFENITINNFYVGEVHINIFN